MISVRETGRRTGYFGYPFHYWKRKGTHTTLFNSYFKGDILSSQYRNTLDCAHKPNKKPYSDLVSSVNANIPLLNNTTCDNGGKSTISQGIRAFGLRRTRSLGEAKTHLQHTGIAATASNVFRFIDWLNGIGPTPTRVSAFFRATLLCCVKGAYQ